MTRSVRSSSARHALVLALVSLLVGAVAACGQNDATVGVTGTPGATTGATARSGSVPPAPPSDPLGVAGRPVLEWISICYGACAYQVPEGLPQFAVYDDGTVVAFTRVPTWGSGSSARPVRLWTEERVTIAPDELASLLELARQGGLSIGGVHANGSTRFTADGGGSIFVARLDGITTTIEAPLLYGDDSFNRDATSGEERQRLLEMQKRLEAFVEHGETQVARVEAWALVARDSGLPGGADTQPAPTPWVGPDLATLPDTLGTSDPPARCAILADDAIDVLAPSFPNDWGLVSSDGKAWSVELVPLLPHQQSCADLSAAVDDQHLEELQRLRQGP